VTDALAAERATIPGRAHSITATGEPYNQLLHAFLSSCEEDR
jgi:hypothetical protein